MHASHHLADTVSFQRGLRRGLIFQPRAQWDAQEAAWIVTAFPQQGGGPWVLSQGPKPVTFANMNRAWEAADGLRELGSPFLREHW